MEQRNKGTKEQQNKGTKEQRNKGTIEQRNKGKKKQRNKGTKEQSNNETKSSSNWVRHNQVSWSSFEPFPKYVEGVASHEEFKFCNNLAVMDPFKHFCKKEERIILQDMSL